MVQLWISIVLGAQNFTKKFQLVLRSTTRVVLRLINCFTVVTSLEEFELGQFSDLKTPCKALLCVNINYSEAYFCSELESSGFVRWHYLIAMVAPWGRKFDQPNFIAASEHPVKVVVCQLNQMAIYEAFR